LLRYLAPNKEAFGECKKEIFILLMGRENVQDIAGDAEAATLDMALLHTQGEQLVNFHLTISDWHNRDMS
jgi:hypothetical protein